MTRRQLSTTLLAEVSRSFYLTIRILPHGLREPVALAYLLARASDTIADAVASPREQRTEVLHRLLETIRKPDTPFPTDLHQTLHAPKPGEARLLKALPECLAWLREFKSEDRAPIRSVLDQIIRGQISDLEHFEPGELRALPTAADLDEYTYRVAGSVGEFWTDLCLRHVRRFSKSDPEWLRGEGRDFGKGLQLINILRDLPEDLRGGRCYLPASELAAQGLALSDLRESPALVRPIFLQWAATAETKLEAGFRYLESIRSVRLRYALFLPWYFGMKTLVRMRAFPPLETSARIKITRGEVRRGLLLGIATAFSNQLLQQTRKKLRAAEITLSKEKSSVASR